MMLRIKNTVASLEKFAARPWYPFLVGVLAFADLSIAIIPTDVFVVSAVLAKPRRWFFVAIVSSIFSALGALFAAALCSHYGAPLVAQYFPGVLDSSMGVYSQGFLIRYGIWTLFFLAVGPLPLQPGVLLAGVMHLNLTVVFGSVLFGRIIKYVVECYLAAKSPQVLARWFPALLKDATLKPGASLNSSSK